MPEENRTWINADLAVRNKSAATMPDRVKIAGQVQGLLVV